jgi:hypothetical protein
MFFTENDFLLNLQDGGDKLPDGASVSGQPFGLCVKRSVLGTGTLSTSKQ